MGNIRSSHYTDVGNEQYVFNKNGSVDLSQFRTGDLIFFSTKFPKSKIKRLAARWNNELWDNCGIVVHAPNIFGDQMLIFEHAKIHPDDHLPSEFDMQTVHSGYRLVNLHSRLSSPTFEAIGIRKEMNNFRDKASWRFYNNDAQQVKTVNSIWKTMSDGDKRIQNQQVPAVLDILKDIGYVPVSYAELNLNEMAGGTLNKYTRNKYTKTHVFIWPSERKKTSE